MTEKKMAHWITQGKPRKSELKFEAIDQEADAMSREPQ